MGPEEFFQTRPLRLTDFDMNSLSYAMDSRSYLLLVVQRYLKEGDLVFFIQYFLPQIKNLDQMRIKCENPRDKAYSTIKAKKYQTLITQMWETLPIFCRFNSPKLSEAVSTLLGCVDPMVNKNYLGLRHLALKSLSELINHCRVTRVVTEQIKKTRAGLQRISLDYVSGLSTLYTRPEYDKEGQEVMMTGEEKDQILKTLTDFSSIAKTVKLSNIFLSSFAEVLGIVEGVGGKIQENDTVLL